MSRTLLVAGMMAGIVMAAGCTSVQKSAGVGAAGGAAGGAAVGHYLTTAGGGLGAVVGLGVGAAGGALASDYYYNGQGHDEIKAAEELAGQLQSEIDDRDQQVGVLEDELARERAQQSALLTALDEAHAELTVAQKDDGGAQVQVDADEEVLTVTFQSEVLFAPGKAGLSASGKKALKEAVRTIRARFPGATIEVRGHTDSQPIRLSGYKSNWDLSCARAVAVMYELVESEGLDGDQLSAVGFGDTRPVASNATPAGRARNRRAELVVRPVQP